MNKQTIKYDFPVKLSPVKSDNILIPEKAAVIRQDTKEPIGLVSNRYGLLHHKDVIDSLRKSLSKHEYTEKISLGKNGAHLFSEYTLPKLRFEVKKGDDVSLRFIAKNSYDGTKSFQLIMGAFRFVCDNGLVVGNEFFSLSRKHIESDKPLKDVLALDTLVSQLSEDFSSKTIPQFKKMIQTPVQPTKLFDKNKIDLPKYILDIAKKEYEKEKLYTVWNYYNSFTKAITHYLKRDKTEVRLEYLKRSWKEAVQFV